MALTPDEQAARSAGYATPEGTHYISEGDDAIRQNAVTSHKSVNSVRSESQAGIADVRSESQAGDASVLSEALAAATAANPYKTILPDGTDIDTVLAPGVYLVSSTTAAATMINWPTDRAGVLTVSTVEGSSLTTQGVVAHISMSRPPETYTRSTLSVSVYGWGRWNSPEWVKGRLGSSDAPINADTFRELGSWQIVFKDDVTGLPGTGQGFLEVMYTNASGIALQRFTERVSNSEVREWKRYTLSVLGWSGIEWDLSSGTSEDSGGSHADPVSDHAGRVEYARTRRGGGVGTAGLPVVMLRFDHWLQAFQDDILPILQEHDLPGTLNMNFDNLSNVNNGGGSITWEDVQSWNQYHGIEIANHGSTHTNASTRDTIYHEIVNGRRNLEAAMPRVSVETWQEHGSSYLVATDEPGDIGLDLGRTPANFFESYAGKLVLAEHAVIEGKTGGFYHPINGHPQIGQSHISVDRSTAAEAIDYVRQAQVFNRGVTLYVHPGTIGTGDDYMTLAEFRQLCEHLAAERDAGRLMVMTAAGGAFADRLSDHRENLLTAAEFGPGWEEWWANYNGYTITDPGPNVIIQSSSTAVPMSHRMLLYTRFGWAMGAAHELVVRARATGPAAQLTLRAEQLGNPTNWETQRVLTPTEELRTYRMNLSLPRDRNITQMTFYLGGPDLEIHGPPLLAAI